MTGKNASSKNEKNKVKTATKAVGKDASNAANKIAAKPSSKPEPKAKSSGKVSAAAGKGKKNAKNKSEGLDEDLLMGEEVGDEEIPDLSDFDENSTEVEVEIEAEVEIDSDEMTVEEAQAAVLAATTAVVQSDEEDIILTDAEGRRLCRVRDCDQIAAVEIYCRYHYLMNWKRIQAKREILAGGKLERYVDELTSRYPDKFLDILRKDLRTEKDFLAAIAELEIDESALENDFEDEAQSYIDEVRGVTEAASISDDDEF